MAITLKSARVNKNLTQKEAANLIGIRRETLSSYEKGKTYPDVPVIQKIEAVYDIKYGDLIFLTKNNT